MRQLPLILRRGRRGSTGVKGDKGDTGDPGQDGAGSIEEISDALLTVTLQQIILYVDQANGDDGRTGFSPAQALSSVEAALDKIRTYHNATIFIVGDYTVNGTAHQERVVRAAPVQLTIRGDTNSSNTNVITLNDDFLWFRGSSPNVFFLSLKVETPVAGKSLVTFDNNTVTLSFQSVEYDADTIGPMIDNLSNSSFINMRFLSTINNTPGQLIRGVAAGANINDNTLYRSTGILTG